MFSKDALRAVAVRAPVVAAVAGFAASTGCRSPKTAGVALLGVDKTSQRVGVYQPPTQVADHRVDGASAADPGLVPAAIGPFGDTSAAGMAGQLKHDLAMNSGYRQWKHNQVHYLTSLNVYGRTYLDDGLASAENAWTDGAPVGAATVLELYKDADGASFAGWAVLAKGTAISGPTAWFSFELDAPGGVPAAMATVDSMGAASCAGCHQDKPGYMVPIQ